jgi:hypothetical protein
MLTNKWILWMKRIGLALVITVVLMTGVLAIHIYQVTHRPRGGVDGWQMARIDFDKTVDSTDMRVFRQALHQQNAVFHSYANIQAGTIAFAFDPTAIGATDLCKATIKETGIPATLLQVTGDEAAKGCPVIDKNSLTYRISSGFQKLFQ